MRILEGALPSRGRALECEQGGMKCGAGVWGESNSEIGLSFGFVIFKIVAHDDPRRHGVSPSRQHASPIRENHDVTVCVAALFRWNYGTKDSPSLGVAAITASDRKITAGDVEYEPQQLKIAFITPRAIVLIAGDYSLHSEAILETRKQIRDDFSVPPQNIALIYGRSIQAIKRRQAEDLYLAPLGMNTDTFIAQQRELSESFVDRVTRQIQNYKGEDVEALIVGSDGENAHIYAVDTRGMISCLNDVGFAAIGIGAWHAKSRLMQAGYVNTVTFAPALSAVLAAKKAAEVAPGVGTDTDIHIIFKSNVETLRRDIAIKLLELYESYKNERLSLDQRTVNELQNFIDSLGTTKSQDIQQIVSDGVDDPKDKNPLSRMSSNDI